ncbi:hypothetical protein ES703_96252 [subsurface metagenome]
MSASTTILIDVPTSKVQMLLVSLTSLKVSVACVHRNVNVSALPVVLTCMSTVSRLATPCGSETVTFTHPSTSFVNIAVLSQASLVGSVGGTIERYANLTLNGLAFFVT